MTKRRLSQKKRKRYTKGARMTRNPPNGKGKKPKKLKSHMVLQSLLVKNKGIPLKLEGTEAEKVAKQKNYSISAQSFLIYLKDSESSFPTQ